MRKTIANQLTIRCIAFGECPFLYVGELFDERIVDNRRNRHASLRLAMTKKLWQEGYSRVSCLIIVISSLANASASGLSLASA